MVKLILTPLLSGQSLHCDVVRGVASQGIDAPWLVHTAPANIDKVPREVNINANRQQLQQLARAYDLAYSDHVLLLDSDVVMPPGAVYELARMLDDGIFCAAMPTKQKSTDHIVTACALIRWEHYELLRFWDRPVECQCLKIAALGQIAYSQITGREVIRTSVF